MLGDESEEARKLMGEAVRNCVKIGPGDSGCSAKGTTLYSSSQLMMLPP